MTDHFDQKNSGPIRWKSISLWLSYMDRKEIVRLAVFGLLFAVFSLVTPLGMQILVNTFLFTGLAQPIFVLVIAVLIGLILAATFRMMQIYLVELLQRRIMVRASFEIGRKIKRADPRFLHAKNGLELVNQTLDLETAQKAVSGLLIDGFALILQVIFGLSILAFYHQFFIVFDVFFIASIAIIIKFVGLGGVKTRIKSSKDKHQVVFWFESLVSKRILLNHPSAELLAENKTQNYISRYLDSREAFYTILFRQVLSVHTLQIVASVGLLGAGGYLVVKQQLTVGQLVAAELLVSAMLVSLLKFQKNLEDFYDLASSLEKVADLFDLPQSIKNSGFTYTINKKPSVELEDVQLFDSEQGSRHEPVNFILPSGQHMVIRGRHGTGKSKLIEAISSAFKVEKGTIKIDNIDIQNIDSDSLRSQILFVNGLQYLPGTILENLTLGQKNFEINQVQEALEKAGLAKAFNQTSLGLNTYIQNNGYPLTPGQRVQLALARCFLFQPRLILIDQGLDILDESIREIILKEIFHSSAPWTVIATSYQSDVVKKFDLIYDMNPEVS